MRYINGVIRFLYITPFVIVLILTICPVGLLLDQTAIFVKWTDLCMLRPDTSLIWIEQKWDARRALSYGKQLFLL